MSKVDSNIVTSGSASPAVAPNYEQQMSQDLEWAMTQGSLFFEDRGKVQESLRRIAKELNDLQIPYAIAGGMAVYLQGYRRYTEDVDILVTKESAKKIYAALEGRGYVRPFANSKNLRDTQSGVKIELLLTGGFPGDGKPKSISFPDPSEVSEDIRGIKVLRLTTIISLKLASWMTGEGRAKDRGDVEELIRTFDLREALAEQLHPYVQSAYRDVWRAMHRTPRRFVLTLWDVRLPSIVSSMDTLLGLLPDREAEIRGMRDDGLVLDASLGPSRNGVAYLVSEDPAVATKYSMVAEAEFAPEE